MNENSAATTAQLLNRLESQVEALRLPAGLEMCGVALRDAREALRNLERRLGEGPEAPLRVALFGPTGAGKSKLFNSLLGVEASPAGFRRPYTLRPVYSVPGRHRDLVRNLDGEARVRESGDLADLVLIDTPDFDSVERQNRATADRILGEAEAIVFVTDVQKYADQSTWEYLERLASLHKPAIVVLNKVVGEGAASDFRRRLDERAPGTLPAELIVIPELAVDDRTPLPRGEPGLERLRAAIVERLGKPGERRQTLVRAFAGDLARLGAAWASASAPLQAYFVALDTLGKELAAAVDKAGAELVAGLDARLDPAMRSALQARLLERIQRIDLLRYPRQLLALPFEGLRKLLGGWWPWRKGSHEPAGGGAGEDPACQRLEDAVLGVSERFGAAVRREPCLAADIAREELESLRLGHAELVERYAACDREYREWLRREAEATASQLTGEHKLKFIVSQVIYNAVVIGVQIHTAGHFTLVELATDGVLSPLVAKGVGLAVSSERVGQFERQARAERARLLRAVIDEAGARLRRAIESRLAGREAFAAAAAAATEIEAGRERMVQAFERAAPGRAEHVAT